MSDETAPASARPLVAHAVSNRGVWVFGGVMALAAVGLFTALEARRSTTVTPGAIPLQTGGNGAISAPPELILPPQDPWAEDNGRPNMSGLRGLGRPWIIDGDAAARPTVPAEARVLRGVPGPPRTAPTFYPPPPFVAQRAPQIVANTEAAAPPPGAAASRVNATVFVNPSLTIPQGAIIHAVLETALDSNKPGFARAIVSRDVRSFDGSRVLIRRGSRLVGEYQADVVPGQNRIGIMWQRLTRPDGVQIQLESPAADPLGQTGVRGKVNSHFFTRFGAALLQSSLDIGVGLATRSATNGTVIVGMPGSMNSVQVPGQEAVKPTIKVRQGSSVSVFVARDLDFSTVDQ